MALSLLFNRQVEESIAGVNIDATVRQRHKFSSSVTSFPVEAGANISDNISDEPVLLQLDCIISDNPIQLVALGSDLIDNITGQASRSRTAAEELIRIKEEKQTFTVVTGLRVYENMAFNDLEFLYDEDTGKAVRFTASFTELEFVESQTIGIERDQLFEEFEEQASIIDDGKQVADMPAPDEIQQSIFAIAADFGLDLVLPGAGL